MGHPRAPDHPRQEEFDAEIENPAFSGSPSLDVQRVFEDGPVVVTTGEGAGVIVGQGPFRFAFNDLFTFRDSLIARVDSYVVALPGSDSSS
ncbi:nuclear transport factor 2-like protein [Paractinoplanes durhamensis]|uniref:hypothetical protein n=1 Tax=Paractinoplanes durhamensis TaxID=113563 RepID=UPI003637083E